MRLFLCAVYVFMGSLIFAIPNMSRRELLFAVPVPPDFRESPAGRHAIARFRAVVAALVLAGVCALLLAPPRLLGMTSVAVPFAIGLGGGICGYLEYRKLAPAAVQYSGAREAELTAAPEKLPWFGWLGAGPFLLLASVAAWLHFNWNRIPARFPIHFGPNGQPNRWAERTTKGVYGLLLFGAEICAFLLITALACWFGARRSRSRPVMLGWVIAIEGLMGLVFGLIGVQATLGIPVWLIAALPAVILIPLIVVFSKKMSEPWEALDPTPNECWRGDIYYNPNDAALFVEKRAGLGYTLNFANRSFWFFPVGLALVIASAFFILP